MRNLFKFVFIMSIFISSCAFAQEYANKNADELLLSTKKESTTAKKRLLYCVKTSCCSVGSFGVDIWSDTTCTYIISTKRVTIVGLKNIDGSDYTGNEIEIENDITLFDKDNSLQAEGLESIMKAGLYKVIDGEIAFEPTVQKIRVNAVCIAHHHQGNILGHDYNFTTMVCIFYPVWQSHQVRSIQGGYAVIDLTKEEKLLQLAKENGDTLIFDEDIILEDKYIIKAGKYPVEYGKIYTRNIQLK